MADELQLVSASDVLNLRCFPVIKAPDQTTTAALAEVRMDAAYFQYQVSHPCTSQAPKLF